MTSTNYKIGKKLIKKAVGCVNIKIDQITKNLYVSNLPSAMDHESLKQNDIDVVLTITNINPQNIPGVSQTYKKLNINHYCFDIADKPKAQINDLFEYTNLLIDHHVKHNENILVHCTCGISRSVTIILAYLTKKSYDNHNPMLKHPNYYKWKTLLSNMKNIRSIVQPNIGFMNQLQNYEKKLKKNYFK